MPIPRHMTQDEMLAAITELDQAIYAHEQWTEEVYATLICHLKADERDLNDESYRKCRFGQWYYGPGSVNISDRPGFAEVENEHKRMHQNATTLLRSSSRGAPIALPDYERFVSALKRTRLEIQSLKHDLEIALYDIDALTGVPGRKEMLANLRGQREFVVRGVHPCTLAMLDIDHFKLVNDAHGHLVGDQVLASIAHYMRSYLRPYDIIFRYGGEEFLLCMPDAGLEACRGICDRLRIALADITHAPDGTAGFHVTVSIGIAELSAEYSIEEAINRADQALLAAKAAGRNRVLVWSQNPG